MEVYSFLFMMEALTHIDRDVSTALLHGNGDNTCKLSLLQHRNEPMSALCVPACKVSMQHASYMYTRNDLLHVAQLVFP